MTDEQSTEKFIYEGEVPPPSTEEELSALVDVSEDDIREAKRRASFEMRQLLSAIPENSNQQSAVSS